MKCRFLLAFKGVGRLGLVNDSQLAYGNFHAAPKGKKTRIQVINPKLGFLCDYSAAGRYRLLTRHDKPQYSGTYAI